MARKWIIYTLSDPRTGEVRYVGVTHRGARRRLTEHLSRVAKGSKIHVHCWIRKLMAEDVRPAIALLEEGDGDWKEAERRWIADLKAAGVRLTNLTDGGDGLPGYRPTAEVRAQISARQKGKKYPPGRHSAMLGRRHTPEARAAIAAAGTGRRHEESAKRKLSEAHRGKKLSAEHVAKMVASKRGKALSEEHKRKIAATTTNRQPVVMLSTQTTYTSITEAARAMGVNEASIYQAIRKGCRCRDSYWARAEATP